MKKNIKKEKLKVQKNNFSIKIITKLIKNVKLGGVIHE